MNDRDRVEQLLNKQLQLGEPIYYSELAQRAGLPPMDGAWLAHPLCSIFAQLDQQDYPAPLRTSLVIGKETGQPGPGYFETLERLRGKQILKSEREAVWISQYQALLGNRH
jgi:hypothetical protein